MAIVATKNHILTYHYGAIFDDVSARWVLPKNFTIFFVDAKKIAAIGAHKADTIPGANCGFNSVA